MTIFGRSISDVILMIVPLLMSLSVHEFAHAYVANRLGDPTPKERGRLTLNPLAHLDLLGTLCILMTFFIGWAKPVPVDPRYFRNPVTGMSIVAAAGPLSNLALAIILALAIRFVVGSESWEGVPLFFRDPIANMLYIAFYLNLGLCLFNLIPIPPFDGFRVLSCVLPRETVLFLERGSLPIMLVFFVLFVATGAVGRVLWPLIRSIASFLL